VRSRTRLALTALALGAVVVVDRPVPVHAAPAQAVTTVGGVLAHGYVSDARYGDGTRWLEVVFVVPGSQAVSTGPLSDSLDLAKPWAVITEVSVETGAHVCSTATNVSSFDAGRLGLAGGGGEAWRGTSVEVACDDGAGYSLYRVRWDPGSQWLLRNQLTLAHTGGKVQRWSAPPAVGSVETVPLAVQPTTLTVCGVRTVGGTPQPSECFTGTGTVVPETARLSAEATLSGA
jgi:hypothetical protein